MSAKACFVLTVFVLSCKLYVSLRAGLFSLGGPWPTIASCCAVVRYVLLVRLCQRRCADKPPIIAHWISAVLHVSRFETVEPACESPCWVSSRVPQHTPSCQTRRTELSQPVSFDVARIRRCKAAFSPRELRRSQNGTSEPSQATKRPVSAMVRPSTMPSSCCTARCNAVRTGHRSRPRP